MKKWKIKSIICLILFLVPFIIVPSSRAELVNIWGTSQGTTQTYTYKTIYNGTIDLTIDNGDQIFSVINIWDNDGNNYTELLYKRQKTTTSGLDVDLFTLDDDEGDWNFNDFRNIMSAGELHPLLPIGFNATDNVGVDWTAELQNLDSITNYTITYEVDAVLIHHWDYDTDDLGAYVQIFEYIRWDNTTGWLISYRYVENHGNPANYTSTLLIQVKSITGGLFIDITLIIGIIGAITGAVAIVFSYLTFRKSRPQ
ncbi:MAG TPA: hypothetical protein VMV49_07375 [Candidatus Deferrimicrobium sp.]|nr:hypothetical protein [Candidatus Deferrimicrobium sp.]